MRNKLVAFFDCSPLVIARELGKYLVRRILTGRPIQPGLIQTANLLPDGEKGFGVVTHGAARLRATR